MPNFHVWPMGQTDHDSFWVYAIDDFDAREQIAATLRLNAHDEDEYGCVEDNRFKMPLNLILHDSGEWTEVATPQQLRCSGKAKDGGQNSEA
ncbi:hypothetical protein [Beijerinckia sp. L45]|uniref:hypothetical protein n=1 Tax=Beijerinckia sp. L45 TaxID=1641855 RepID=UPI00131BA175|nr:hypothetical protein [Beijerinckia sp. L45]